MSDNIRISGLNALTQVSGIDYFPIVHTSSIDTGTTYRTTVTILNDYLNRSGSAWSASFASRSFSSSHAIQADTASYLFPWRTYATTASNAVTTSYAFAAATSSWGWFSVSSSHAIRADSASYLYPTILYRTTASAALVAGSSSYAVSASQAFNSTTASYAHTASYAMVATTASFLLGSSPIPVGTIVAYAGATAPDGWLACDGKVFSEVTYADLATKIGTNYGNIWYINTDVKSETPDGYGGINDGYISIVFGNGGSGWYSLTVWAAYIFPSTTYYNVSGSNRVISGLSSGTYVCTFTDIGVGDNFEPITPAIFTVPYGPVGTEHVYNVNYQMTPAAKYRTPNMTYYYTHAEPPNVSAVSPFIYIIKT